MQTASTRKRKQAVTEATKKKKVMSLWKKNQTKPKKKRTQQYNKKVSYNSLLQNDKG